MTFWLVVVGYIVVALVMTRLMYSSELKRSRVKAAARVDAASIGWCWPIGIFILLTRWVLDRAEPSTRAEPSVRYDDVYDDVYDDEYGDE